jgi:dihydrofolate synthase/folylpolyglutamate synthase
MDSTASPAYQHALDFLFQRVDYERAVSPPYGDRELKLDRTRELLARLGDPQNALPIVHVAGSKGKGSTSAMIASVLSAAGYRAGLFSSPHLDRVEERMAVDGRCCSQEEFVALFDAVRPVAEELDRAGWRRNPPEPGPTYFELTMAMALLHFVRRGARAAVLEVGLGGRLDSTNVCQPLVSVITSISFDHMRQLGNTLAAIAREKAGIIKPGVTVVNGATAAEPQAVIAERAIRQGSPLLQLGRDFDFDYASPRDAACGDAHAALDYRLAAGDRRRMLEGVELRLVGRHQAANAAVALTALDELARQGWDIPESAIRRGLVELHWPARIEVAARRPTVVLDTAHNVASIEALLATLEESFAARERILVFATTREKEIDGMLAQLLPRFDRVIFTQYRNNPRGVPPEELAAAAARRCEKPVAVCLDPAAAWELVQTVVEDDDLVCITGSFFIASEIRALMATRPLRALAGAVTQTI